MFGHMNSHINRWIEREKRPILTPLGLVDCLREFVPGDEFGTLYVEYVPAVPDIRGFMGPLIARKHNLGLGANMGTHAECDIIRDIKFETVASQDAAHSFIDGNGQSRAVAAYGRAFCCAEGLNTYQEKPAFLLTKAPPVLHCFNRIPIQPPPIGTRKGAPPLRRQTLSWSATVRSMPRADVFGLLKQRDGCDFEGVLDDARKKLISLGPGDGDGENVIYIDRGSGESDDEDEEDCHGANRAAVIERILRNMMVWLDGYGDRYPKGSTTYKRLVDEIMLFLRDFVVPSTIKDFKDPAYLKDSMPMRPYAIEPLPALGQETEAAPAQVRVPAPHVGGAELAGAPCSDVPCSTRATVEERELHNEVLRMKDVRPERLVCQAHIALWCKSTDSLFFAKIVGICNEITREYPIALYEEYERGHFKLRFQDVHVKYLPEAAIDSIVLLADPDVDFVARGGTLRRSVRRALQDMGAPGFAVAPTACAPSTSPLCAQPAQSSEGRRHRKRAPATCSVCGQAGHNSRFHATWLASPPGQEWLETVAGRKWDSDGRKPVKVPRRR